MLFYLGMALFGYSISGEASPQLVTEIPPLYRDWLLFRVTMNIAILLVSLHMIVSIPTLQLPARDQLIHLSGLNPDKNVAHVTASLSLVLLSAITAMVFTNLINILSCVGGFTSCFFIILFPGLSNAKVNFQTNKARAIVTVIGTVVLTIFSFLSVALGALDEFGVIKLKDL